MRAEVAQFYGDNGHEGVDPIILAKLMFLLFYDDVPSEREPLARLPERLDYLWFLGYSLEEVTPHHSVLSKARRHWGRTLQRHEPAARVALGQQIARGAEARRDRRRRPWLMEGSFGRAANEHGFKRARWRRPWRQEIQDWR